MIKHVIFLSLIGPALFCSCKKVEYPEDTYRGDPLKLNLFMGRFRSYTVNGVDSLDLLNNYFFNNSNCNVKIQDLSFSQAETSETRRTSRTLCFGEFDYHLAADCKTVRLFWSPCSSYTKNPFVQNGADWEILKLKKFNNKSDVEIKLKATFNQMDYIIDFH